MANESSRHRRICCVVDDFGLHDGVNIAALQLVDMARVHGLGCMVGAPKWSASCASVRALAPVAVDVGLHLDLTEHPLLKPSLQSLRHWIFNSYAGRIDRRLLRLEIRAQLDAFEAAVGRPPAYVDGHQHVHQLPGVRDELLEEIAARYGQRTPWLRATNGTGGASAAAHGGWSGWLKAGVIAALGASGLADLARRGGIAQNHGLVGVYGFDASRSGYLALLAAGLRRCADAALVMCHPSLFADEAGHHDGIAAARLVEFEVLRSPAFGHVLADGGFSLQPMSRILGTGFYAADAAVSKLSR